MLVHTGTLRRFEQVRQTDRELRPDVVMKLLARDRVQAVILAHRLGLVS